MHQHSNYSSPGEEGKKKKPEKNLKKLQLKFPQNRKGNSYLSPRGTKSPTQDKPKEKHTKTHTNQTSKDQTQKKYIKSSKGKAASNIQGKLHMFNS